ncbi:hypothetical protein MRX96_039120 [Rhipicephalus microplus]
MELDSGSPVSIISKDTFLQHQGALPELSLTDIKLTCTQETIPVQGTLSVDVRLGETASQQSLLVVACKSPSLCGRDWLATFNFLPRQVNATQMNTTTKEIVRAMLLELQDIFTPGCGTLKGPPLHVQFRPDAQPQYYRPRSVPYALRVKVE